MELHGTEHMELRSTEAMEDDRLYQQTLTHMQRGHWEQAVETILQLQEQYGVTSEVEALLEEARFKAALDKEPLALQRPSWSERWRRWRSLIVWGLSGSLVVTVLLGGLLMYQRRVVPTRLARQTEARLNELRQQGQFHLAARQYDQAIQIFEDLLSQAPDDQTALEGIAVAEEKQRLGALTQRVDELMEAREWEAAVDLMDKIQAWKPDYGGLDDSRGLAERQMQVEITFEAAETAYSMEDWEQALSKYSDLQSLDRSFEKAVVTERLFHTYVHRGQELIATAGTAMGPIEEAHELFVKALVLRPGDPQAVKERDWAAACIEGNRAYERGDWERAAEALSWLYIERPDYPGVEARISALGLVLPPPSGETEPEETASDVLTQTTQPDPDKWYDLSFMGARANCILTGITGVIKSHHAMPVQGVQVQVRNSTGKSWTSSPSDVNGQYKIPVANGPVADVWTAYVVRGDQPVSPPYSFQTDSECVTGLQEYKIDWQGE